MSTEIVPRTDPRATQFQGFLSKQVGPAIAKLLPKHMTPEKLLRLVYEDALKPKSKLLQCEHITIFNCIVTASQLGLEIGGPNAGAFLIPRWNSRAKVMECTLLVSYKGLAQLALRSGQVADISGGVIYGNQIKAGLVRAMEEPPVLEIQTDLLNPVARTDEDIVGAYCVVRTTNGGRFQRILNRDEIIARRDRGGYGRSERETPWDTDFAAMARKSAIRALFQGGVVPMSAEYMQVVEAEEASEETYRAPIEQADAAETPKAETKAIEEKPKMESDGPPEPPWEVVEGQGAKSDEQKPKAKGLPLPERKS